MERAFGALPTAVQEALWTAYGPYFRSRHSPAESIVLASTGRGGSTWLAEILSTLKGRLLLWEPLHPQDNRECMEAGFGWENYIPRGESFSRSQRAYLERVFRGECLSSRFLNAYHVTLEDLLAPSGLVVKFVNANMLLHRIAATFGVQVVLQIRHPCAVVASQLHHGGWDEVTKDNPDLPRELEPIFADYPHWSRIWSKIETQEEVLAFLWAISTAIPLQHFDASSWHLLPYEHLVAEGRTAIDTLFSFLGESTPSAAYEHLNTPSMTASEDSSVVKRESPLKTWHRRLTDEQVDRILQVVDRIGVDVYDRSLMPNADKLPVRG